MSSSPTRRTLLLGAASSAALAATAVPAAAAPRTALGTSTPPPAPALPTWGTSRVALFFAAHQDDELLQMGSQVRADVEAGHQVVVVNCSDGSASGARTGRLARQLGFVPSVEDFVTARDHEFLESTARLGVPLQGRVISPDRYADGTGTPEAALRIVADWTARFPTALVRAHSFVDAHRDHRAIGEAVDGLVAAGTLGRENDVRFFFSRVYLGTMPTPALQLTSRPVGDVEQTPFRDHDPAHGRWGVGYLSTWNYFDSHRADPVSYWHRASSVLPPPLRRRLPAASLLSAAPAGHGC
ncbi:PIG-L deacetylase family protein [Kytococcus sedentarius]|uniref:PIG-L deacetylase family protein n=1 Tax=Kytococcus sedentarius TaxID=1276 RepID=UPI0035BC1D8B